MDLATGDMANGQPFAELDLGEQITISTWANSEGPGRIRLEDRSSGKEDPLETWRIQIEKPSDLLDCATAGVFTTSDSQQLEKLC